MMMHYTGTGAEDGREMEIHAPEKHNEPEKVYTPEEIKALKKKYQPLRQLRSNTRQFRREMCEIHGVTMKNWRKIEKYLKAHNIPMEDYIKTLTKGVEWIDQ